MKLRETAVGRRLAEDSSVAPHPRRSAVRTGEIGVTVRRFVAVFVVAVLAAGCAPARAADQHTITLTLVRHGQSAGNASGFIDTSTPGPELTPKGWCQATIA